MKKFSLIFAVALTFSCLASYQSQDKSQHTLGIYLYAKPVREGENQYTLAPVDGKAGYIVLFTAADNGGVKEVARYDLHQSPKMQTKEQKGQTIRNWPVATGLSITSRNKSEWAEDRRDDRGIKVPRPFSKIEMTIETKYSNPYDPVTIFATNYDQPDTLVKKEYMLLDYQSALAVYEFVEAGTSVNILIENPDAR